jgi:hypothetical protein
MLGLLASQEGINSMELIPLHIKNTGMRNVAMYCVERKFKNTVTVEDC